MSAAPGRPPAPIGGSTDPRFRPVRDAFAANFTDHGENGAALCVIAGGRVVADLWGGYADAAATRPWAPGTLVNVFSVGKGWTAALAARLAGQGRLTPATRVAGLWPEFAAAGKSAVTVADLLSHRAGLPAVTAPLPGDAMLHPPAMAAALAAQRPWWEPGTAHGYHVNTFGFLLGEVIRRATGHTAGTLLAREIAGPLGADIHIGLPAPLHRRCADFLWPATDLPDDPDPGLHRLAYFNPRGASGLGYVNTAAWRTAEIPSTNGHATARGLARLYTALAAGGGGVIDKGALADAVTEHSHGPDLVLGRPSRFGLGFQLTQTERPLGPGPGGFGHFGAGGSLGFADPGNGVAVGYVMNTLGPRWQNPRNRALVDAVYACL